MQETSRGLEVTASGSAAGLCLPSWGASSTLLRLRHSLREVPERRAAVQLAGPAPGARARVRDCAGASPRNPEV